MNFQDFLLKTNPVQGTYLVGYDSNQAKEIRIPIENLSVTGNAGQSVQLQYSANGTDSWHFPAIDTDKFLRMRVGTQSAWSIAFKIVADENEGNDGGSSGTDAREIELQNNGTYIQWRYVGDEAWQNLVALSEIKGNTGATGPAGPQGQQGIPGANGQDGNDLCNQSLVLNSAEQIVWVETKYNKVMMTIDNLSLHDFRLYFDPDWNNPKDVSVSVFNQTPDDVWIDFRINNADCLGEGTCLLNGSMWQKFEIIFHVSDHQAYYYVKT